MKKIIFCSLLLSCISLTGFTQSLPTGAEIQVELMRTPVSLTNVQANQILNVFNVAAKTSDSLFRASNGTINEETGRALTALRTTQEEKINSILNADQLVAYKKFQEDIRGKRYTSSSGTNSVVAPNPAIQAARAKYLYKFTDEQTAKATAIYTELAKKIEEFLGPMNGNWEFNDIREKYSAISTEAQAAVMALLTPEQNAIYEKQREEARARAQQLNLGPR